MTLDVHTLNTALTADLLAVALALPALLPWRHHPAARSSVVAAALAAVGWALMWCRTQFLAVAEHVPAMLLDAAVWGLWAAALVCLWQAVWLWRDPRPLRAWPMWLLCAVTAAGPLLGVIDPVWPAAVVHGGVSLLMLFTGVTALRHESALQGHWRALIGTSMVSMAALTVVRGLLEIWLPITLAPGHADPVQGLTLLAGQVALLVTVVGLFSASREEVVRRMEAQAVTDSLTGLLNRRAWTERAMVMLSDARRYNHPLVVAMIDVDHFRQVNDTHGHARGDQALQLLARLLREELRSGDLACRYGGEEFCVMLNHTREGPALSLDQRLRDCLRLQSESELGFLLQYSAGLAALSKNDQALDDLLRRANDALYEAKQAGRGQVVLAPR